jgi:lipopolysaccharide/colanic/teichoic acid biosynthesis glycosyltransferase
MGERKRELTILILGDAVCFGLSLWLTLVVRYFALPSEELLSAHLGPFAILTGVWIFIFYIAGLYDKHTVFLKKVLAGRIVNTQIANIVIAALLFLIIPFGIAPKTNLVIYLVVSVALITTWRLSLFNYFSPKSMHKAILIADGEEAIDLADEINNNDRYNYSFVRIVDEATARTTPAFEEKLLSLIQTEGIRIVVANPRGEYIERALPILVELAFTRFAFTFLDFYRVFEDMFDRVPLSALHYDWFVTNVSQSRSIVYDVTKRAMDIMGALMLLIPCAVIFPVVILAIKVQDRGPIFYRTERIGQFNRVISILKFRSMTGMDTGKAALATTNVVTPLGRILRKTRLDELPQLVNVLRGDLSFIGPRPEMPALAEVYAKEIPYYNARHAIKPGLSGWAQINNYDAPRGGIDIPRTKAKLSYDLFYLRHRSLLLDLQIAMKTIATLVMRTGT